MSQKGSTFENFKPIRGKKAKEVKAEVKEDLKEKKPIDYEEAKKLNDTRSRHALEVEQYRIAKTTYPTGLHDYSTWARTRGRESDIEGLDTPTVRGKRPLTAADFRNRPGYTSSITINPGQNYRKPVNYNADTGNRDELSQGLLISDLQRRFKSRNPQASTDNIDWSANIPRRGATFGEGVEIMQDRYPAYDWR